MTWLECATLASKYGAMMVASSFTSPSSGWLAHRKGEVAMVSGFWSHLTTASTQSLQSCVLGRDGRSEVHDKPLSNPTEVEVEQDGAKWAYQDLGLLHFDECLLAASEAGALIITPHTVGATGDGYWSQSQHMCNTYI